MVVPTYAKFLCNKVWDLKHGASPFFEIQSPCYAWVKKGAAVFHECPRHPSEEAGSPHFVPSHVRAFVLLYETRLSRK